MRGRGGRRPSVGQSSLFAPRPPKRPLPLRARRRRAHLAVAFVIFLVLSALAYGAHHVSYLPQFSVESVVVTGTEHVSPKLVSDYVWTVLDDGSYHFLSRKNVLLYPRAILEKAVVGFFPRIASASVSRSPLSPTGIVVSVTERQPFAAWCMSAPAEENASGQTGSVSDQCYQMDAGGFIFALTGQAEALSVSASSTEYVFRGGLFGRSIATSTPFTATGVTNPIGKTFMQAHLPALVALLNGLGQAGFTPEGAEVENDTDFFIPLAPTQGSGQAQGFTVKAAFGTSPDTLVKNLNLVLSSDALKDKREKLEYIDLRFGDRVYYKLKGETETSGAPR